MSPNYNKNKEIILKRRNFIFKNFKINTFNDRIGPIITIPYNKIKNKKRLEKYFMTRHIHTSTYSLENFKKVFHSPNSFYD